MIPMCLAPLALVTGKKQLLKQGTNSIAAELDAEGDEILADFVQA